MKYRNWVCTYLDSLALETVATTPDTDFQAMSNCCLDKNADIFRCQRPGNNSGKQVSTGSIVDRPGILIFWRTSYINVSFEFSPQFAGQVKIVNVNSIN